MSGQEILDILDGVGLGTFIGILASIAAIVIPGYKYIKSLKQQIKNNIREEVQDEQKEEKIDKDLKTTIEKITQLDQKIDTNDQEVQQKISDISEQVKKNTDSIASHEEILERYKESQDNLYHCIKKINTNVGILVDSDRETIRTVIIQEHQTFIDKGEIDLLSLQNVERLYKKYVEESDDQDEFIERLMNSLRELPTRQ